jgi:hypothetical protein
MMKFAGCVREVKNLKVIPRIFQVMKWSCTYQNAVTNGRSILSIIYGELSFRHDKCKIPTSQMKILNRKLYIQIGSSGEWPWVDTGVLIAAGAIEPHGII